MRYKIRKYHPSDIQSCRGLWAELTQRHRDIYNDQTIGGDNPGNLFDLYSKNEKLHGPWVLIKDDQIVGFTGLLVEGEEADVEPVIVSKEYRNQGFGKALIEYAIQEAKNMKIRFLSVKPVARNIEAISFFIEAGFNITGHIDLFQDLSVDFKREWKTGITIHGKKLKY
ncbi:MAG: GNAT family N-acetyltransferase [Thermodesulfobacteriota bacterium]|nr:GNAT family N-acetyltransferase [Thermodesulfobacteriota bacterium]